MGEGECGHPYQSAVWGLDQPHGWAGYDHSQVKKTQTSLKQEACSQRYEWLLQSSRWVSAFLTVAVSDYAQPYAYSPSWSSFYSQMLSQMFMSSFWTTSSPKAPFFCPHNTSEHLWKMATPPQFCTRTQFPCQILHPLNCGRWTTLFTYEHMRWQHMQLHLSNTPANSLAWMAKLIGCQYNFSKLFFRQQMWHYIPATFFQVTEQRKSGDHAKGMLFSRRPLLRHDILEVRETASWSSRCSPSLVRADYFLMTWCQRWGRGRTWAACLFSQPHKAQKQLSVFWGRKRTFTGTKSPKNSTLCRQRNNAAKEWASLLSERQKATWRVFRNLPKS